MRIRKNAKLSSLLFAQGGPPPSEMPSAYMCQLNQSPWDVIPFTSLPDLELDSEDFSFSGNGNWVNDPAGADSGMGAMMVVDDIQVPKQDSSLNFNNCNDSDNDDDNDNDNDGSGVSNVRSLAANVGGCRKSNGKGWHCRKAPKEGHFLCDHHFNSQKTQNSSSAAKHGGSPAGEVSVPRRRGRPTKKAAAKSAGKSSSNSNQFYYYSGFGPLWGKHRNDKGATAEGWESSLLEESSTPSSPYSLQIDDDDVVDEDELSGDTSSSSSSSGGGRKRTRKPVKARSLKSLM